MRLARQFVAPVVVCFSIFAAGCGGGGSEPAVGPPASISPLSGSSSTVPAGSTAPIALVAKVLDAGGRAVSGAGVTWGTSSGSISPATATTDGSGQTTAQWTPGKVAGAQTATASVSGAGSATFSATVTAGPLAQIRLTPDTTRLGAAGSTAQLSATGLDAFDNAVPGFSPAYTIDNPTIATVNGNGLLTSVKTGTTTVRAVSGSISASAIVIVNATAVDPCAGVTMTLAVGGSQTLTGPAAGQFCVNGATGAEFVAVPFFGTGNGGKGSGQGTGTSAFVPADSLTFTVSSLANTAVSGPPNPSVLGTVARANVLTAGGQTLSRDYSWESRFRERTRPELTTLLRATRQNRHLSTSVARNSLSLSPDVSAGSSMSFNVAVLGCDSIVTVQATVQAVTTHAIVVSDNRNPTGGFQQADYAAIAKTFDEQVWKTDTDNFGVPYAWNWSASGSARDPNAKIILFFTKAVNELTPRNSSSFVGGFFYGRDLYPKVLNNKAFCAASNETEMFYLLAPDPNGDVNQNPRSTDFVRSITIGTVAHEFQHLINAAYRVFVPVMFRNGEATFLDEGLAHIAEELNYYAATTKAPRTNLDANIATSFPDQWVAFGDQNATRFREYLKNPDRYPPYSVLADTSLAVRGGIWSFLRYATDRRVATGTPEQTTWFQLVNPPQELNGVEHLTAVYGTDVLTQIRDWTVANYLDDALSVTTPSVFQHPSWNERSVETFVNGPRTATLPHANGTVFPLKVQPLTISPISVSLADGGAAYLRFGVDAGKVGGGTVTSGSALPASFSITVIRTK